MSREWPDVETAALDWLEAEVAELAPDSRGRHADTETPANLQDVLPFVLVRRLPGRDDGVTDYSVLDLEVFAGTRATAYALSEAIRARFSGRSHRVGQVVLDRVSTESSPSRRPHLDENMWRFGATYRISARRCRTREQP